MFREDVWCAGGMPLAGGAALRLHRRIALLTGLAIAMPAALALPFGSYPLPAIPAFLPAFGAFTFFADLLTALLLLQQARAAADRAAALLGIAYLFSSLVIVPHLLAFPGVFSAVSVIGGSASAVWLWCMWHAGFALCVAWYALAAGRERAPGREKAPGQARPVRIWRLVAGTVGVVAGLAALATAGLPWLPVILVGGSFVRLNTLGIGPFVVGCNLLALVVVVLRLRGRSVLSLWLVVAMVAATLDVVLTLYGGGRFALGWYLARCLSMATGAIVLMVLLSELLTLFSRMVAANGQLELLSLTDPLTGIANRRAFERYLQGEWRRAQREQTPLSMLMIDIDQFKAFNDLYGHPVGDECLRRVAHVLEVEARRPADRAARIGGEEFTVLLPVTEGAGAERVAGLVHERLRGLAIEHADGTTGRVTVSIGVATAWVTSGADGTAALIEAADAALYRAKQSGRNQTCVGQTWISQSWIGPSAQTAPDPPVGVAAAGRAAPVRSG